MPDNMKIVTKSFIKNMLSKCVNSVILFILKVLAI